MKLLKFLLIIFYIPLFLLFSIGVIGLIHRLSSSEVKSISLADLKMLATAISINLIIVICIWSIRKLIIKWKSNNS